MKLKLAVLPGDGIGPEIMEQGVAVMRAVCEKFGHDLACEYAICGADAIDKVGDPFPEATFKTCMEADAVLFASVGDPKFDNDNEELLFDRANKILLHDPHITKDKEELIHEIFAMEVNVIHIHEVLKNHERGFDKGIKLVKLDRAPVVKCPKMEIAGKVTPSQIASVEINSRDRLNQNARRRALGAEGFNGRYFQ